jgi:hypothetical protein
VNGAHAPNSDRVKSVPSLATLADETPILQRCGRHGMLDLALHWHCAIAGVGPHGVRGRKSHSEQIWSARPQMADIDFIREDFSVGPKGDIAGLA